VLDSNPQWMASLSRQAGGEIGLRAEPAVPISGGYAENR
jgi:hypothetical protein